MRPGFHRIAHEGLFGELASSLMQHGGSMTASSSGTPRPAPAYPRTSEDVKGVGLWPMQANNSASVSTFTAATSTSACRSNPTTRAGPTQPRAAPRLVRSPVMRQPSTHRPRTANATSPVLVPPDASALSMLHLRLKTPDSCGPLALRHLRGYVGLHRRHRHAPVTNSRLTNSQPHFSPISPPFAPPEGWRVPSITGVEGAEAGIPTRARSPGPAGHLSRRRGAGVGCGEQGVEGGVADWVRSLYLAGNLMLCVGDGARVGVERCVKFRRRPSSWGDETKHARHSYRGEARASAWRGAACGFLTVPWRVRTIDGAPSSTLF
ncbi:hypothetical protein C8J57DRAFT_1511789 [Mycena rebaudengoi]|nr:hypothetical protein C8J57DRAFT_1511789 [Mycena rebaudengoi]